MGRFTARGPRRLPDAEIVRLYVEDRIDSDTIGARANCSATCVLDLVREAGHTVRGPGGVRRDLKISDAEIARRYLGGESGPVLARILDCTPSAVYAALRREGVATRPDVTLAANKAIRAKRRAAKNQP